MTRTRHIDRPLARLALKGMALAMLACLGMTAAPLAARAEVSVGVSVSVGRPPPPLPVYEQPPIPGPGYIWTPGYWFWDADIGDYYWVPGAWIMAPFEGALWTPGYWGWSGQAYVFHVGYWSRHVGFYGGVHYGYGYTGNGYEGGYWGPGGFHYNQEVNHITNVHITNVYRKKVINNVTDQRVSYNGGRGGLDVRPTPAQASYARERHTAPVAAQMLQRRQAQARPELRASVNHGRPPGVAPHPGAADERAAQGEPMHGAPGGEPSRNAPPRDRGEAGHPAAPPRAEDHHAPATHPKPHRPHGGGDHPQ